MLYEQRNVLNEERAGSVLFVGGSTQSRSDYAALFEKEGFSTRQVEEADAELYANHREGVDLVIYEGGQSSGRAYGFCRASSVDGGAPIILLSDNADNVSRIIALEVGADELLPVPVDTRLLLAQARALMRRTRFSPKKSKSVGRWSLDRDTQLATAPNGATIELAKNQVRLMALFLEYPGRVITPDVVSELEPGLRMGQVAFRTAISRLRNRLGLLGNHDFIRIVRGSGYTHIPDLTSDSHPASTRVLR